MARAQTESMDIATEGVCVCLCNACVYICAYRRTDRQTTRQIHSPTHILDCILILYFNALSLNPHPRRLPTVSSYVYIYTHTHSPLPTPSPLPTTWLTKHIQTLKQHTLSPVFVATRWVVEWGGGGREVLGNTLGVGATAACALDEAMQMEIDGELVIIAFFSSFSILFSLRNVRKN